MVTGIVILLFAIGLIWSRVRKMQEDEKYELELDNIHNNTNPEMTDIQQTEVRKGTKDLFYECLERMGCQYQDDEDGFVYFPYQGGEFKVYAENDSLFIQIYFLQWFECDVEDIDKFAKARKLVNEVNIKAICGTVVYTIEEGENRFYVHSKFTALFCEEIPLFEAYLRRLLDEHFKIRQLFYSLLSEEHEERS